MSSLPMKSLTLAVLLLATSAAQADILIYTDQGAYLAAVGNTGVDNYDDLPINLIDAPLRRQAGAYSYEAQIAFKSRYLYGAGEGSDHWLAGNNRHDNITLTGFSEGVRGVGGFFFGSNVFGNYTDSEAIELSAVDVLGNIVTYKLTLPTTGSFLGFVSTDAFKQVSFKAETQTGVWGTVNDLHLSVSAVPEPGTYGMLLGGLGVLGFLARRRKA